MGPDKTVCLYRRNRERVEQAIRKMDKWKNILKWHEADASVASPRGCGILPLAFAQMVFSPMLAPLAPFGERGWG